MRTFIALDIPDRMRDDLAAVARCLQGTARGQFIPRENYHMTLAFLGEVPQAMLDDAESAMDAALADCIGSASIELRANGLGTFGRPKNATLRMGFAKEPALMELVERLRDQLEARGFALDGKTFLPHMTLGRHASFPAAELPPIPFPEPIATRQITLYKSTLAKTGATYDPLYSASLTPRD